MKKLFIIAALAIGLAGCQTVSISNPFTPTTLAGVEDAYGEALTGAIIYKNTCVKAPTTTCRSIVKIIQSADNYAYGQIVVARKFVKNNPTLNATGYITAAYNAVQAFITAKTNNGVK